MGSCEEHLLQRPFNFNLSRHVQRKVSGSGPLVQQNSKMTTAIAAFGMYSVPPITIPATSRASAAKLITQASHARPLKRAQSTPIAAPPPIIPASTPVNIEGIRRGSLPGLVGLGGVWGRSEWVR